MPSQLISQRIDNLLDGVSRQPQQLRLPSQAQEQLNALSSPGRGLSKRPGTEFVATLSGTIDPDDVFIHPVVLSDTERYLIIVSGGTVSAFDLQTGLPVTIYDRAPGSSYFTGASDLRAVSIGSTTLLINQKQVVSTLNRTSRTNSRPEALAFVRQVDFAVSYTLDLDGNTVTVTTPDGATPDQVRFLTTESVAEQLVDKMNTRAPGTYNLVRIGSTIHVTRTDSRDFSIRTSDSLGDTAMRVVKGAVQRFEDLPHRAIDGFTVEIAGDGQSQFDNYWVVYDEAGTGGEQGVWRETVAPGTVVAMDPNTLPHQLTFKGDLSLFSGAVLGVPTISVADGIEEEQEEGMDFDENGNPIIPGDEQRLQDDGEARYFTVSQSGATKVKLGYAVDTTEMDGGTSMDVVIKRNFVEVARRRYFAGERITGEEIEVSAAFGQQIRLELQYSRSDTLQEYRKGRVVIPPTGEPPPEILKPGTPPFRRPRSTRLTSRFVVFEPNRLYPPGMRVTVSVNGIPYNFTPNVATTGTLMASTFRALIGFGVYGADLPKPGVVSISSFVAPTVSVTTSFDAGNTAWVPNAGFSGLNLVGQLLRNVSDGSSGVVTETTSELITATLTGGVTNRFSAGDVIEVTATGTYFVLGRAPWREREVGDLNTNPWPSFVNQTITDAFVVQNRLGLISQDGVIMSGSGDLFNFFRTTSTDLLDEDVIDVRSSHPSPSFFHTVFAWEGQIFATSDTTQFVISGDPAFTPTTVRIDPVSEFPNAQGVRPVIAGDRLFFARNRKGSYPQVMEVYRTPFGDRGLKADDLTEVIPGYLPSDIEQLSGDASYGILFARCATEPSRLYVYLYRTRSDGQKLQSSWSAWEFPGTTILSVKLIDGVLTMVLRRGSVTYLESVDIGSALAFDP